MDNTKTIITRGLPEKSHKKLERISKKNRVSINFIVLQAIDSYLFNYDKSIILKSIK